MARYLTKMVELSERSENELVAAVDRVRDELFRLKFQHGMRQLEDTSKLYKKRHEVARLLTALSQRRRQGAANQ